MLGQCLLKTTLSPGVSRILVEACTFFEPYCSTKAHLSQENHSHKKSTPVPPMSRKSTNVTRKPNSQRIAPRTKRPRTLKHGFRDISSRAKCVQESAEHSWKMWCNVVTQKHAWAIAG